MDSIYPIIGVGLVFGILRILLPYKEKRNVDEEKLIKNASRYNRLEITSILPMFFHIIFVAYLFYILGQSLFSKPTTAAVIYYYPDPLIWAVVGTIFGFGTCAISMIGFLKFFLKDDYDNYLEFSSRKHGFDSEKLMRPFVVILNILGIIAFVLTLNTSLKITDKEIEVNHFFSMQSQETPLSEIGKIVLYQKKKAPNGNIVDNEHYVIYKKDDSILLDESFQLFKVQSSTITYLLEKSNLDLTAEQLRLD